MVVALACESHGRTRMSSLGGPEVATARRRAVTLQDVADEADVAVSTVSRALSNPDRVSPATRHHVQSVAMRLGYRHNRMAAALETSRTPMLALLVADITNPSNFGLIRGAEAEARAAGYTLVLGDTQESPEFEKAHAERLGSAVEGFVLASSRLPDDDLLELAEQRPVVLLNRQTADLPSVITDSVRRGQADHRPPRGAWSPVADLPGRSRERMGRRRALPRTVNVRSTRRDRGDQAGAVRAHARGRVGSG